MKLVIDYLRKKPKQEITLKKDDSFSVDHFRVGTHDHEIKLEENEYINGVSFWPGLGEVVVYVGRK